MPIPSLRFFSMATAAFALLALPLSAAFTNTFDVTLSNNFATNEAVFRFTSTNLTHGRYGENQWLDTAYTKRIKYSVTNSMIAGDLTNFPVLVKLTNAVLFASSKTYGEDLRFTSIDGTNLLNFEIENWDAAGKTANVWVRLPLLSSGSNTSFYAYFANAGLPTDASFRGLNPSNAWDTNFRSVWHLKESGSGAVGEFFDSTTNTNGGRGGNGTAGRIPVRTNGVVQDGQYFDGVNDYIQFNQSNLGPLTLSLWAKADSVNPSKMLWCFKLQSPGPDLWFQNNAIIYLNTWDGNNTPVCATPATVTSWHHYTMVFSNSARFFIDGVYAGTASVYKDPTSANFSLATSDTSYCWKGAIDEARLSSGARSAAWILAEYTNMLDPGAFAVSGTVEDLSSVRPSTTPWVAPKAAFQVADLATWTNFAVSNLVTNGGLALFQIATNDGSNASDWLYWSNSIAWVPANGLPTTNNRSNANSVTEVNAGLTNLPVASGKFNWRACFLSDGTNELYMGNVSIAFTRVAPSITNPAASGTPVFGLNQSFVWTGNSNLYYTLLVGTNALLTGSRLAVSNVQGNQWAISNTAPTNWLQTSNYYVTVISSDPFQNATPGAVTNDFQFQNNAPSLDWASNKPRLWLESPSASDRSLAWQASDSDPCDVPYLAYTLTLATNLPLASHIITNISLSNNSIDLAPVQTALSGMMLDGATIYWRVSVSDPHLGTSPAFATPSNFYLDVTNNTPAVTSNLLFTVSASNLFSSNTVFSWSGGDFDQGDLVTYNFQVVESVSGLVAADLFTTNTNLVLPVQLTSNEHYVLRVRGRDQKGLVSSLQTNWGVWTNGTTNYFIYDTTLASLATAFPTVLSGTTVTKASALSWSNAQAGYGYQVLVSPTSNFTSVQSTTNLSGASVPLTSLASFSNLVSGSTNYYAMVSVLSNTLSAPSYIYASGLGSFVFQDDANPMALGALSVSNELYIPGPSPTHYSLFFSGTEANGMEISYVFTFYTNTNVVVETRSNVTGTSLDVRLLTNYAALPDNVGINWEVTAMVNSHQTLKTLTGVSRSFFLNKANDAPTASNLSAPLDGRLYLNDPITLQSVSDPDLYDAVSNEFVASLYPAFPAFSLYTYASTNRTALLSSFTNGSGTAILQDLGASNAVYVRVRSFDNRGGLSPWLSATNASGTLFAGLNDLRLVAPVPVSPVSLSVTQGHGGTLSWSNAVTLPSTNAGGQPLLYAIQFATNSNFNGMTSTNVDLSLAGSVAFSQVDFPRLTNYSACFFRLQAYYGAGNAGSVYGTNLGSFTFLDDNAPVAAFVLTTTNEVYGTNDGTPAERSLRWLAASEADGDRVTYDLYLFATNTNGAPAISTNTNLATNVLDIASANNFQVLQDNTRYWVMITNIRDSHGRENVSYPSLASYRRDFLFNLSNDLPTAPSNLAFTVSAPAATNFAVCAPKAEFGFSATDPDSYDIASLQYHLYVYSTNDVTNASNYYTNGVPAQPMYEYVTSSNKASLFDLVARYATRNLSDPGLTNGRPFVLGVRAYDQRGGASGLWVYPLVFTYSNNNLAPTVKPQLAFSNGLLGSTLYWTNGSDPDDSALLYRIEISASSSFATLLASTNAAAQQGAANQVSSLPLASLPGFASLATGRAYFIRIEGHDPYDGTNLGYSAPSGFYLPRADEDLDFTEFHIGDLSAAYAGRSADKALKLTLPAPGLPEGMLLRLRSVPYASVGLKTNFSAWVTAFGKVFPDRNRRVVQSKIYEVGASALDGTRADAAYATPVRLSLTLADAALLAMSNTAYYRIAQLNGATTEWNILDSATQADGLLGWVATSNGAFTVLAHVTPMEALSSPLAFPNPVSIEKTGAVSLSVVTTAAGSLEIQVLDLRGRMVFKTRQDVEASPEGRLRVFRWDARDSFGQLCAPGVYVVRYLLTSPGQAVVVKTTRIGVK
ncbi:MAG: DUF2341 domain-containing protein [Spirochaetes bacterium]|nr:DUF2341 domain-containing protein [Spirochaetota bacterium]